MRRRLSIFALSAWAFAAPAQDGAREPAPVSAAAFAVTPSVTAAAPGGTPQHFASPQLLNNEVAVLLEHLQSQHVYLKHLENVRRALEKELSIVRLMRECDGFGSTCTGRGIVDNPAPPELHEPPPPPPEEPLEEPYEEPPGEPESSAPEMVYQLPVVAGIYRGTASLIYADRRIEARRGTQVGPFMVTAVALDKVRLEGPHGEVSLSPQWVQPQAPLGVPGEF